MASAFYPKPEKDEDEAGHAVGREARQMSKFECRMTKWRQGESPSAQPIEASLAKPDLNAPTSVSISASVIGVENVHVPVLMMLQPSL